MVVKRVIDWLCNYYGYFPDEEGEAEERLRPYSQLADQLSGFQTDDIQTLRESNQEARSSLNKRIEAIEEKDDKAISTVRINLILIGLVVTAATSVPSSIHFANWCTIIGFVLLVGSTVVGIWAYMYTNYTPGITSDYLEEIESATYSEREWLQWMNQRYQIWLRSAASTESDEATLLGRTHYLQIGAILLLILGVILGLYGVGPASIAPSERQLNETFAQETPRYEPQSNPVSSTLRRSGAPVPVPPIQPAQDSYECSPNSRI